MRSSIAISSRCQPATWARMSRTDQSPYHTPVICSSESPSTAARSAANPASISCSKASLLMARSDALSFAPLANVPGVLPVVPADDEQDVAHHVARLEHRLRHRRQRLRQRVVAALKLGQHLAGGEHLAGAHQEGIPLVHVGFAEGGYARNVAAGQ